MSELAKTEISTEDKGWVSLARDARDASKMYFDAGVRDQIDNDLRQFYGVHPSGSKYHSDAYKGKSKLFRPKTRSTIRANEATAAEALFTTDAVVSMDAEDQNDPMQLASAAINQSLLQYRLTKSIPWFLTCIGAYQDAMATGICISYQNWEYNKKKRIDRPFIDLLPAENFRFDAASDWRDVIGTSPYLIHEIPMYVKDVKARAEAPAGGEAKWMSVPDTELLTARQPYSNSTRQIRERGRTDSVEQNQAINDFSIVWVHRNIVEKNGEDWIYYTLAGGGRLLSKPRLLSEVYWHGKRPYTLGFCIIETHKAYPSGISRLTHDVQAEINEVTNQRIDNVKLAMNKRWLALRGRAVDVRSLTRSLPGSVTMVTNMDDVKELEFNDVTASSYQEQDRLNLDFDDLSGSFSGSSVQSNRKLNETVGGMNILTTNANKVSGFQLQVWKESWLEPTLRQLMLLEQRYESDQVILALAKENSEIYEKFGIDEITDELLMQELTVRVNVGMSATNPQQQVERFMFGLVKLKEVLADGVLQQYSIDVDEVIKEIFGKLGFKDGSRFFAIGKGDPQIEQMKQQIQQLTQQLADKNGSPEMQQAKIDLMRAQIDQINAEIANPAGAGDAAAATANNEQIMALQAKADQQMRDMAQKLALADQALKDKTEQIESDYAAKTYEADRRADSEKEKTAALKEVEIAKAKALSESQQGVAKIQSDGMNELKAVLGAIEKLTKAVADSAVKNDKKEPTPAAAPTGQPISVGPFYLGKKDEGKTIDLKPKPGGGYSADVKPKG